MRKFIQFIKEEFFWSDLIIILVATVLGATFGMLVTGNLF